MTTHFWDPDQVDVIFDGIPLSGFAEDGIVTFEETGERFITVVGVDGDITRSKVKGKLGVLTIKLMSSSKGNDVLSAAHNLDILSPGGAGVVAGAVNDRNSTSLLASPKMWIIGFPPLNLGKQAVPNEWKIQVTDYTLFIGGTG